MRAEKTWWCLLVQYTLVVRQAEWLIRGYGTSIIHHLLRGWLHCWLRLLLIHLWKLWSGKLTCFAFLMNHTGIISLTLSCSAIIICRRIKLLGNLYRLLRCHRYLIHAMAGKWTSRPCHNRLLALYWIKWRHNVSLSLVKSSLPGLEALRMAKIGRLLSKRGSILVPHLQ